MGLRDWFSKRQVVNQAHPRDPALAEWFGGGSGAPAVTATTALGVPAVYACVNVLAESIGALPLSIWQIESDGTRRETPDHPLYALLTSRPCPHMSGVEWVEWLVMNTALRGDAFCRIVTDARGRITSLPPLSFTSMSMRMEADGFMRYTWSGPGGKKLPLRDDEVFRLPWKIQADGSSLSPISVHRESFALALSARKYQLNLMTNGAAPKGAIKVPTTIGDEAAATLLASWERRHRGTDNAGKTAVFDGGLEWVSIGMSNEDAQFVELMQMTARDVARVFRVQPHKIGDLANATFSNIEHQSIEFVTDTLLPWVRRIEARVEQWLLTDADRARFSVEFNLRGLLRGDAKARSELYRALFYAGAITSNEIRRMEGLNPMAGGDRTYVQSGSAPTDIIDRVLLGDTPAADAPPTT